MHVCSCCRGQGHVAQRLFQYEKETAHANDERLANTWLLEERDALIRELYNQNAESLVKHIVMQLIMLMAAQLESKSHKSAYEKQEVNTSRSMNTTGNSEGSSILSGPPSLVNSGSEQSSDNLDDPPCVCRRMRTADLHPSGFKVLISHINKFSGEKAADNFKVWLEDY